jgi:hypothetical protein
MFFFYTFYEINGSGIVMGNATTMITNPNEAKPKFN